MSEPTGDGNQKPDPDPQPEAGQSRDEGQEQTSGSVFSDPTAPVWADPTAPIPATPAPEAPSASTQDNPPVPPPPLAPGAPAYPTYGQQPPAAPLSTPPPAPPMSNPYAQQPPPDPYTQPTGEYGQPTWSPPPPDPYGQPMGQGQYGQPQYGGQYPAYGQSRYTTGAPSNTSGIVLTIVSGVSMLGSLFMVGLPSLVFGIMALSSNSTDPVGSRKKARTGWIIYAVNAGLAVLVIIVGVIAILISATSGPNIDSGL